MGSLVAGVDSSTQSCKVVIRDAATGALVRSGRAAHPAGTEVHPDAWWDALATATEAAGGLDDVAAVAVAGQQHGLVCLDEGGEVVRPALLWNDLRSAQAANDLVAELGPGALGRRAWADAIGSVPVASFTITKLRWVAQHEPANAARTAAVCLPHDWLSWRLAGEQGSRPALEKLATDRGEASGTGYWSPATGEYRLDLLERAFGRTPLVPRVLAPSGVGGRTPTGALVAAGTGDNAAGALGLGAGPGDVVLSVGTSGTVCAVAARPTADAMGTIAGFADATGRFLPLACTVNAARVLDATAALLGVDLQRLDDLALEASPGANGLTLVPYLEGERTPNRPDATGALHGIGVANLTPACLARAAFEGVLCGLADALDALVGEGVSVERILLIGGVARSHALRRIAPTILYRPVVGCPPGEYVADGAARQAAWAMQSELSEPPNWTLGEATIYEADPQPEIRERYAHARALTLDRDGSPTLIA